MPGLLMVLEGDNSYPRVQKEQVNDLCQCEDKELNVICPDGSFKLMKYVNVLYIHYPELCSASMSSRYGCFGRFRVRSETLLKNICTCHHFKDMFFCIGASVNGRYQGV